MKCPNCGRENPPDSAFCNNCGQPLAPAEPEDPRQALLDRLLPQPLRDKIQASGTIEPERRPVTVLFADLSGFTALGEKLDPEELSALTNECLEAMVKSVFKYEGFVDKLIGDAVMALFGAPVAHEDDPERTLRCALDMKRAISEIASAMDAIPEGALTIHAGVHTGDVVAGPVGPDLRLDYSVVGDTVNLASRFADAAAAGQILVSDEIQRATRHALEFDDAPALQLKGIEGKVPSFVLTGLRPEPEPARGIRGLFSPLVGREKEFSELKEALQELTEGKGQIVTIMGEPGIGKTRLVDELHDLAREEHADGVVWLEGKCLSYGGAIAYWPFLDLLKGWAGIRDEDGEAQAARKLRLSLRKTMPDALDQTYPYLASLLATHLDTASQEKVKYLDPESLRTRIYLAVREWAESLSKERSLILVLEDLHWADPSTADLLTHLLSSTDQAPIMLLLVSRPERDRPWWDVKSHAETEYPHRFTEIELEPLSSQDSDLLVHNLLAIEELPGGIKASILEKTEGNPFFVEEIIRALIDEGVIVRQNGKWRATTKILALDVPDTLQGVILARIDRLQAEPRRVLQRASVIGRTFLYRILSAISNGDGQLQEPIARLQKVELILEKTRRPELEYMFKHSLTQEVAYGTLVRETRQEAHQRVAHAVESLFPDRLEEFYGLLAHHYAGAEDREKAIDYLIKAGDQAKAAYANQEAMEYYRQAHQRLKTSEAEEDRKRDAALLISWGSVHVLANENDEAIERFSAASEIWRTLEHGADEAEAQYEVAWAHFRASRFQEAVDTSREALDLAERAGADPGIVARGYLPLIAGLHWGGIDPTEGEKYARTALPLLEAAEDHKGLGDVYKSLGLMTGELEESQSLHLLAAENHTKAGDLATAALDYNNLATIHYQRGEFDTALEYARKGFELAERLGALRVYGVLHSTLSEIHTFRGEWDKGQRYAEEAREIARRIDDRQLECFTESDLAWVAWAKADWQEALEHHSRALELSTYTTPVNRGFILQAIGWIHILSGQVDDAPEYLDQAFEISRELVRGDRLPLLGYVHRALGCMHTANGAWENADQAFAESLRIWKELEDPGMGRMRVARDHGLMFLRRGDAGDEALGREMLGEAIRYFRSIGHQWDLVWTERELKKLGLALDDFDA